jgi:hypothetical protein
MPKAALKVVMDPATMKDFNCSAEITSIKNNMVIKRKENMMKVSVKYVSFFRDVIYQVSLPT